MYITVENKTNWPHGSLGEELLHANS